MMADITRRAHKKGGEHLDPGEIVEVAVALSNLEVRA